MKKYLFLALVPVMFTGCAIFHPKVDDSELASRAAFALNVPKDSIRISDVTDSGMRTEFTATTRGGKRHACYVTAGISVTGRNISDAICSGASSAGQGSCNALNHAAGKC